MISLVLEEEKVSRYVRHGAEVVKAIWTLYHLLSADAKDRADLLGQPNSQPPSEAACDGS